MSERWRMRGIRGAITVETNDPQAIGEASTELVQELIKRNAVDLDDIASIIFTLTPDLDAAFPALGARQAGLGQVPLMCATEIPVPGAQPRCLRVLMHVNTVKAQSEIHHVYLREAVALRPDLDHQPPGGFQEDRAARPKSGRLNGADLR